MIFFVYGRLRSAVTWTFIEAFADRQSAETCANMQCYEETNEPIMTMIEERER